MVVLAAAVVPHPPLLVPDLAAGAAAQVAPLLAACDRVVAGLLKGSPRTVVLLGPGPQTRTRSYLDPDQLAGFGAQPAAPAPPAVAAPAERRESLPLSLAIGRWLLERADGTPPPDAVLLQEIAVDAPARDCERLGARLLAEVGPDSVWLALGDGSNRRGPRSPGHDDPRAAGFDAEVVRAFAAADLAALLGLDPDLATQLGAAGRAVWQALAGAVATAPGWTSIEATVHYDDAPFGVEYLVADWLPRIENA